MIVYGLYPVLKAKQQTKIMKWGWEKGKILKALYKIFNESPARRDVYLHEGTSKYSQWSFAPQDGLKTNQLQIEY